MATGSDINLRAIVKAKEQGNLDIEIAVVVSHKNNARALSFAQEKGIPAIFLDPAAYPNLEAYDQAVVSEMRKRGVELVVMANWLKIISQVLADAFDRNMISFHPSLLPAFGGAGMYGKNVHRAVLAEGVKISGCTAHFVTFEIDAGAIIAQTAVPVLDEDTVDTLAARVAEEERKLVPQVLQAFAKRLIQVNGRKVTGVKPYIP